ncbi:RING-type E3 ubiquitin transferase [Melia azedarach]|nr:RING-type E3 ubiquitin transferase [Melia azedarach]
MCAELKKLIHRISHIYSDIESARPRCTSGIHALCLFHVALDKAKLLIQHCSECSKFYLAITADRIQLRFEKVRSTLDLYLSQIQNIVPPLLSAEISGIIHDLRNVKFCLEPSEDEAGKIVLELLQRDIAASDSVNQLELEAIQLAALRLNITSPLDLLIEKRCIKRIIDKLCDTDTIKKKILRYLLYLLRKYGGLICKHKTDSAVALHEEGVETQVNQSGMLEPPEEFKCPISMRLMYDPVVIASGKTFERVWIEKWFNDGENTCPKTHTRLESLTLTPNLAMKGLILRWCLEHGINIPEPHPQRLPPLVSSRETSSSSSVVSFGSSVDNLCLHIRNVSFCSSDTDRDLDPSNGKKNDSFRSKLPQTNVDSHKYQSSTTRHGTDLTCLSKLALRPWGSQCDVVENLIKKLKDNDQPCHLTYSYSYAKPLIKFLKDAHDLCDIKAQKDGAELLLAVLSYSRDGMPSLHNEEIYTLASFVDSEITEKALAIIAVLSCQQNYKSRLMASGILPSVLKILDTGVSKFHELAIKILCNLSCDDNIIYHIVYLDCIRKLVHLLEDPFLARYCIKIIKALCMSEESRTAVAEANPCITSLAKLLETATKEEEEHLVDILLSLCYERAEYCQVAMTESVVQCLVDISVNGNSRGKKTAKELLKLLEHSKEGNNDSECSIPDAALSSDTSDDSGSHLKDNRKSSMASTFLGRKMSRFLLAKH